MQQRLQKLTGASRNSVNILFNKFASLLISVTANPLLAEYA
jgi:hypothetical protein